MRACIFATSKKFYKMQELGLKNPAANLLELGISPALVHWNLSPEALTQKTVELGQGSITDLGALAVNTGKFTGRSPKDKFTVRDANTESSVDWSDINIAISPEHFEIVYKDITAYLQGKEVWVRDAYACADPKHRLNIRVINDTPGQTCFVMIYFSVQQKKKLKPKIPIGLSSKHLAFTADPAVHGTRQGNFTIVNFSKKMILIGGHCIHR
jgi:phosphoenolpyruvate carboxykinase (ATP)